MSSLLHVNLFSYAVFDYDLGLESRNNLISTTNDYDTRRRLGKEDVILLPESIFQEEGCLVEDTRTHTANDNETKFREEQCLDPHHEENTCRKGKTKYPQSSCCAICINDFKTGDYIKLLPCQHEFHTECVFPWLTEYKGCCPLCMRMVSAQGLR